MTINMKASGVVTTDIGNSDRGKELRARFAPPGSLQSELRILKTSIAKAGTTETMTKMVIDQRLALAMLSLMPEGSNRNLRASRVRELHVAMTEGRWEDSLHQAIAFDWNGNFRDGQHRLQALIRYGQPLTFWVGFGFDPKKFKGVDLGSKRTGSDLLTMGGITNSVQTASAVSLLLRMERKATDANAILLSTQVRLEEGPELETAVRAAGRMRKLKTAKLSSMAAAHYWISIHTKKPDRLPVFWENLCTGADLRDHDPRLRLREFLQHPETVIPYARGGAMTYSISIRQAAAVVLTWNKWIVDKPISKKGLTWDSREAPDVV